MKKKEPPKNSYKKECYTTKGDEITDYLNFVSRTSTLAERKNFDIGDIFINGAVCKKCGEFVRSRNRHDFRTCKCGAITVDGGSWYTKRGGDEKDRIDVIELFYY